MAAFTDKQEFKIPRHIVLKDGVNKQDLTVDKTLDYNDSTFQIYTVATGAEAVITLPPPKSGAIFCIRVFSGSTQTLRVNDHNGATVQGTLNTNEAVLLVSEATAWRVMLKA
jgi:hypothetical protein